MYISEGDKSQWFSYKYLILKRPAVNIAVSKIDI